MTARCADGGQLGRSPAKWSMASNRHHPHRNFSDLEVCPGPITVLGFHPDLPVPHMVTLWLR